MLRKQPGQFVSDELSVGPATAKLYFV